MAAVKPSDYDVRAECAIAQLLSKVKVAFKNEIKYRLEKEGFIHTVADYAVYRLEGGKAYNPGLGIVRTGLPGRPSARRAGEASVFFHLPGEPYNGLLPVMRKKAVLSAFITNMSRIAGFHAQELWKDAFISLGYELKSHQDVREFEGRVATVNNTIDFIVERDGIRFGVEVKNDLEYPKDLDKKFQVAVELDTIPVFVVRNVTPTSSKHIRKYGGLVKIYETSIYPAAYADTINQCVETVGYPVIALDEITQKTKDHLEKKVMAEGFRAAQEMKKLNQEWLERLKSYRSRLEQLSKELSFA